MDNLEEMDRYLEKISLPRLNLEEKKLWSTQLQTLKLKQWSKISPKNKRPGPDGFPGKFYQTFREELMPMFLKLFQKTAEERTLPNSFRMATITLIQKQAKTTKKKENYRSVSSLNIGAKILNEILPNRIWQHIKKLIYNGQVMFIPRMQGFFNIYKSTNLINHISKLKDKNHIVISTDARKAFDKIQQPFMIKTQKKWV